MSKDLRTRMSKSILERLVDFGAQIQKERNEIILEWGWLADDDESEPNFSSFPISEGLFNKMKAEGLISFVDSDPDLKVEWWAGTGKAGATLYPDKAQYYLGAT